MIPDTKAAPRVSLGLPVYNGEKYLAEAIDSILAQDFRDFELLIVDNASTDRTAEICQAYAAADNRIRYYRNEHNLGAFGNFNRAFELRSGEFFKWCASDDKISPNFIGACVAALDADPDAVLAYSTTESIDENGNAIPLIGGMMAEKKDPRPARRYRSVLKDRGGCTEVFGLFRSSALARSSLHRPYYGSDFALLAETAIIGKLVQAPEAVLYNREHPERSVNIKDKKARVLWQSANASKRSSLEHMQLAMHLFEIAYGYRREAPLVMTGLSTLAYVMKPVQLSRYTLEIIGLVLPGFSGHLRSAGWSIVNALRPQRKSVRD